MIKVHSCKNIYEFQTFLANGGFVPIKYKTCNTHGWTQFFINEDATIVRVCEWKTKIQQRHPEAIGYTILECKPGVSVNNAGYHIVNIGFSALLHRIMAYTFLGNPEDDKREINHKDHNKDNNRLSNIEYVSHVENMRHHFNYKNNLSNKK